MPSLTSDTHSLPTTGELHCAAAAGANVAAGVVSAGPQLGTHERTGELGLNAGLITGGKNDGPVTGEDGSKQLLQYSSYYSTVQQLLQYSTTNPAGKAQSSYCW